MATAETEVQRLDEESLRRDDFREGVRITLGDGQEWSIRRPFLRYVYSDIEAVIEAVMVYGRDDIDGLVEAVRVAVETEDDGAAISPLFRLGRLVLESNYRIEFKDLRRLLTFELTTGSGLQALVDIYRIASGYTPVGNAPPEVPTPEPETAAATA